MYHQYIEDRPIVHEIMKEVCVVAHQWGRSFAGDGEHRVATLRVVGGNFLLRRVPVLDDFAVLEAGNIDGDQGLRPKAGVAAVDHDDVSLGDDHARLVLEVRSQAFDELRAMLAAVGNERIVLDVQIGSRCGQAPRQSFIDKRAGFPFHWIRMRGGRLLRPAHEVDYRGLCIQ